MGQCNCSVKRLLGCLPLGFQTDSTVVGAFDEYHMKKQLSRNKISH